MIFVIGDPHFKCLNTAETNILHQQSVALVQEKKPEFVVILGDVFHKHEDVHVGPLSRVTSWLEDLRALTTVYVLVGNHDRRNDRVFLTPESSLRAFTSVPNVVIVHTTIRVETASGIYVFVPYVSPGRFREALDLVSWQDATTIFAHQEFHGSQLGSKVTSSEGDHWTPDLPYVISGHIHTYHQLMVNLLYPGTPFQENFGEDEDKALLCFNSKEKSYERLRIPIPPKKQFHIQASEIYSFVPPPNAKLQIRIRGTSGEMIGIMQLPIVLSWKALGYDVMPEHISSSTAVPISIVKERVPSFQEQMFDTLTRECADLLDDFRSLCV
jgi:DNA repair exonuclease SbcCD nuclease subunit